MSESNKTLLRRDAEEVWNQGNLDAVDELFATDVILHEAPPGVSPGAKGVKQLIAGYRAALPDFHLTIEDLIAEGDRVVNRWSMTGTHKGELMGIPPTGKKVTSTGISIVRIADGKIAEIWGASDQLGLMQQLGAIPSP